MHSNKNWGELAEGTVIAWGLTGHQSAGGDQLCITCFIYSFFLFFFFSLLYIISYIFSLLYVYLYPYLNPQVALFNSLPHLTMRED